MFRRLGVPVAAGFALALLGGVACSAQTAALRPALDATIAEARELRGLVLAQAEQDPTRVAAIEIRLSRLEEELRRLTGRLEELEFSDRATQARLDKLIADLDARLRGLGPAGAATIPQPAGEAGPPLAAAEPALPERAAPPDEAAPLPSSPRMGGAAPGDDPAARQGYVLGRLPEESLQRGGDEAVTAALPTTPKGHYDAALARLQRGDFPGARDAFASFIATYPSDPLAPSAAYWLAETHYVEGDLDTAAALFARNYQTYGADAPKAPDNLLKMGLALSQIGKREQACQTFAELERRHPNAPAPVKQAVIRGKVGAACSG